MEERLMHFCPVLNWRHSLQRLKVYFVEWERKIFPVHMEGWILMPNSSKPHLESYDLNVASDMESKGEKRGAVVWILLFLLSQCFLFKNQ